MLKSSIDKRLSLLIFIFALIMLMLVAGVTSLLMLQKQKEVETNQIKSIVRNSVNLIAGEGAQVSVLARDYARWDLTYHFVNSPDGELIEGNFDDDSIDSVNLDMLLIGRLDGVVLHSVFSDVLLENNSREDMLALIAQLSFGEQESRGLITFNNAVFSYARVPVTNTNQTREPNGWLLMLREFDEQRIDTLSQQLGVILNDQYHFLSSPIGKVDTDDQTEVDINSIKVMEDEFIVELVLYDAKGEAFPAHTIITIPRTLNSLFNPLYWLLPQLFGILFVCIMLRWMLRRQIITPIKKITEHLQATSRTNYVPMQSSREDELGQVADHIDALFQEMSQAHDFNTLLLNTIGDVIVTIDSVGDIQFVNPAGLEWFELTTDQVKGTSLDYFVENEMDGSLPLSSWIHRLLTENVPQEMACKLHCITGQGQSQWADIYGQPLPTSSGSDKAMVMVRFKKAP